MPDFDLSRLGGWRAHASLMIEMKVSDDAIRLYGFASAEEREWFRLLQTVQSVGSKVALAVLSTLSPRDLQRALALGDKAMIGRAPGVGPKLALRIATELKDKAPAMMLRGEGENAVAPLVGAAPGPEADAVSALTHLEKLFGRRCGCGGGAGGAGPGRRQRHRRPDPRGHCGAWGARWTRSKTH